MRGWVNKFSQLLCVVLLGLCLPHCDGGTSSTRFDGGSTGTSRTLQINGVVVDKNDRGIKDVKVTVRNDIRIDPARTLTDKDGYFILDAELYRDEPAQLRFESGRTSTDFSLPAESVPYPEISVKAKLDEEKKDFDVDFMLPPGPPPLPTLAPADPVIPTNGGPVSPPTPAPTAGSVPPEEYPPNPASAQSSNSAASQIPAPSPVNTVIPASQTNSPGQPVRPITPSTPTPTPHPTPLPPPACPDVDGDGDVDLQDLAIVLSAVGTNNPNCDFNHDGTVSQVDVDYLLGYYGTNCP